MASISGNTAQAFHAEWTREPLTVQGPCMHGHILMWWYVTSDSASRYMSSTSSEGVWVWAVTAGKGSLLSASALTCSIPECHSVLVLWDEQWQSSGPSWHLRFGRMVLIQQSNKMTCGQLSDQNDVKAASWHKLNPLFPKTLFKMRVVLLYKDSKPNGSPWAVWHLVG